MGSLAVLVLGIGLFAPLYTGEDNHDSLVVHFIDGQHGSNDSSTEAFVRVVSPKIAVIQVGTGNPYQHPLICPVIGKAGR